MKKSIIIPILFVIIFCVACSPHGNDIAEYRKNAKDQITSYVQESDFHKAKYEFIYKIMDECIAQIELSDSKEEIDAIVISGKETIIKTYKKFAKNQITSYVQESGFHKEEHGFIYEILDECVDQIDLSDSKEEIDAIVNSGKETILKTYKDFVKNQIISQAQKLNHNENFSEAIDEILNKSISRIDSASNKKDIDFQMNLALLKINMQINRVIEFDYSIEFESKRYDNKLLVNSTQNKIIRSIEELDKFLEDMIPEENYSAFESYDKDFFNENALIFCLYWETDESIQRRVENIYISEGKTIIEIMSIIPEWRVSSDGYFDLNDDVNFRFYIIKVKQSDIENIKDVELFQTFTIE